MCLARSRPIVVICMWTLPLFVALSMTTTLWHFDAGEQGASTPSSWGRFGTCDRVTGMSTTSNPYRGFRFPAEIINQAVWLYHCFSLSLREVELILAARGVVVSYETIREWGCASDEPTPRPSSSADHDQET